MKFVSFAIAATILSAAAARAQDPKPPRVCIRVSDIQNSQPANDEKSITFTMRNGDKWRNDLRGRCSGLRFNGFSWVLHSDDICDGQETLRVLQTGSICMIGKFTKLPKPAPKAN
ncbi:MAG TPA: hypothetical protein VGM26_07150 [Rhizomicrobium sp.]